VVRRYLDSDYGINRGRYYDVDGSTAPQLDALILKLHNAGFSQSQIARRVGYTHQGVSRALKRIAAGRVGRDPRG
jgi:DNA-binding MarR family transcriptional regulator